MSERPPRSKKAISPGPVVRLKESSRHAHELSSLIAAAAILLTPAIGLLLRIGPPGLNRIIIYLITVAVASVAVLAVERIRKWQGEAIFQAWVTSLRVAIAFVSVFVFLGTTYLWMYRSTVVTDGAERGIKGFSYSQFTLNIQKGRRLTGQDPLPDAELIRSYRESNPDATIEAAIDRLWTPSSIALASLLMEMLWVSLFALLSGALWIITRRGAEPPFTPDYQDFVILISAGGEKNRSYASRVLESPGGEASGVFDIDPFSNETLNRLKRIAGQAKNSSDYEPFGGLLFGALFRDRLGDLYRTSEALSRDPWLGLPALQIEPPELLELPWELLFDPLRGRFLGQSHRVPLSYYLPLPNPPEPSSIELPLRVLIVVSSPIDRWSRPWPAGARRGGRGGANE